MNDQPEVWPECSECHAAYIYRRCMRFNTEGRMWWEWLWQADCKHGRKGTPQPAPVLVNADGPIEVAS